MGKSKTIADLEGVPETVLAAKPAEPAPADAPGPEPARHALTEVPRHIAERVSAILRGSHRDVNHADNVKAAADWIRESVEVERVDERVRSGATYEHALDQIAAAAAERHVRAERIRREAQTAPTYAMGVPDTSGRGGRHL